MYSFYYLVSFLLAIIDFGALCYTIYVNHFTLFIFFIIHLVIFGIYWSLNRYFRKEFSLFYYFALLVPGLGLVLVVIIDFLLKQFKSDNEIIEDYEEYLQYAEQFLVPEEVNLFNEINQLSMADRLKYSSEEEKKESIINFAIENTEIKVEILKEALFDDDPEVTHYAASTLNSLEQDFEKMIDNLKERYKQENDTEALGRLIEVYDKYISSGLLADEIKLTYLQDYLTILQETKEKFGNAYEINLKIAEVNYQLQKYSEAIQLLKGLIENNPYNYEAYLLLMKINYYLDREQQVIELANQLKELEVKIPEDKLSLISFWN